VLSMGECYFIVFFYEPLRLFQSFAGSQEKDF